MQISVNTGLKEIEIIRDGKKAGSIWFSPADPALLSRLKSVVPKSEELQKGMHISEDSSLDEALDEANRVDGEIRKLIDWAFGSPVSEVVFGNSYSFTTEAGVSALEQFLTGATEYIESEIRSEAKLAQEHQDKYLSKYRK